MKKNRLIRNMMIFCLCVIVIELFAMLAMKIFREKRIDHSYVLNDTIKTSDGYISIGESDFNNSDFEKEKIYDYENRRYIATQALISKRDNNLNLLWESKYDSEYDSTFNSVIEKDGYFIAVGSLVKNKDSIKDNVRAGLIVKFDKDGRIIWNKTYSVLSDTKLNKIIIDDDNYVVIGQSIYENMELGTHITGGGIIVRYDDDGNVLASNNYGGNKSGSFNDIIKVDDGYIVCGKDAVNYGIVIKFKKDFNREEKDLNLISDKIIWHRTYSNTDTVGFTSMSVFEDKLYVVGALNTSNEKDSEGNIKFKYDAGFVTYNMSGKELGKVTLGRDKHHTFTSSIILDNALYLIMQKDVDTYYDSGKENSVLLKYNLTDNEKKEFTELKDFTDSNDYVIKKIILMDNQILLNGTENNTCNLYGCDYKPVIKYYK